MRVEEAGFGLDGQVRVTVSGVSNPQELRARWASAGAVVRPSGDRLHALTTVQALARAAGRSLPRDEAQRLDGVLRAAVEAWSAPPPPWRVMGSTIEVSQRPALMGILNVTPDSFSDGGLLYPEGHPDTAVQRARHLAAEGADLLDIGGESTRPGSDPVDSDEELRRVVPVLERLVDGGLLCSIDTRKADVAAAALAAGAVIVNDVSGAADPALLDVVAAHDAGYVLMHTRGTPQDMQKRANYTDVVAEVHDFLAEGLERCVAAGISEGRIVIDPGFGFAKTAGHNLALLRALRQFRGLGRPVLVGASRKSFLGAIAGTRDPAERVEESLACVALAVASGAAVLRVHDVAASVRVTRVAHAVAHPRPDATEDAADDAWAPLTVPDEHPV